MLRIRYGDILWMLATVGQLWLKHRCITRHYIQDYLAVHNTDFSVRTRRSKIHVHWTVKLPFNKQQSLPATLSQSNRVKHKLHLTLLSNISWMQNYFGCKLNRVLAPEYYFYTVNTSHSPTMFSCTNSNHPDIAIDTQTHHWKIT